MTHKIYDKLKAESERTGRAAYLGAADCAALIRSVLKDRFPKTKFGVRSSTYSGGSSVRVTWTDGPTVDLVDPIVMAYSGKGFDGSIDMAYYIDLFVNPDGSAAFAETRGTAGSMGYVEPAKAWKPSPEAIRVSGGSYIFTERSYSAAFLERTLKSYAAKWRGTELADMIEAGAVTVKDNGHGAWIDGAGSLWVHNSWGDAAIYAHARKRMAA